MNANGQIGKKLIDQMNLIKLFDSIFVQCDVNIWHFSNTPNSLAFAFWWNVQIGKKKNRRKKKRFRWKMLCVQNRRKLKLHGKTSHISHTIKIDRFALARVLVGKMHVNSNYEYVRIIWWSKLIKFCGPFWSISITDIGARFCRYAQLQYGWFWRITQHSKHTLFPSGIFTR